MFIKKLNQKELDRVLQQNTFFQKEYLELCLELSLLSYLF